MTHGSSSRCNPMRQTRFSRLVLTVAGVMVAQLVIAAPAHADHTVSITHAPPPAAIAGSDARLVVAVEGCWIFCTPISLKTTYRAGEDRKRTIRTDLNSFGPQTAVIVIPGRHIAKPAFSYFLEASQDYCPMFDVCHGTEARLPESGAYSVPVL